MAVHEWFLTPAERGNPVTGLDRRHPAGEPFSIGNHVTPLVHGKVYFAELLRCVQALEASDLLMFTDWRGDPDQLLDGPGTEVSRVFANAARRGVVVKGLIWRSHFDRFAFSEQQNRHLGEEIEAAGGQCLRDMRVRPGGSHHQKLVVLRHPGRPDQDVAFVGGIDLCHSRRDGPDHSGDPQPQSMARIYGPRPPWHDLQLAVRGPAVGDLETVFRERWDDPTPLTRSPFDRLADLIRRDDDHAAALPAQLPDPAPTGTVAVQVLRTYPRRRPGYPFAPDGERSVAHAYTKVITRAHSLVYLEDQYLWATDVVRCFTDALRADPGLHLIAVIPLHPDQDGRLSQPPNLIGRQQALDELHTAGDGRVGVFGIENHAGTPVYVHAKVCIVDDVWAAVGSDNINLRSWTHDSELSCAVIDDRRDERAPRVLDRFDHGARAFARQLRLQLSREHLDRAPTDDQDLLDPASTLAAFTNTSEQLQRWHENRTGGPRPPGRLRPYPTPQQPRRTRLWATPLYRTIYDPDGRPRQLKRTHRF